MKNIKSYSKIPFSLLAIFAGLLFTTNMLAQNNPLYDATIRANIEDVKKSLAEGADINICAKDGTIAILEAAESSQEVAKLLLEKGANINLQKSDGSGVLYNCLSTLICYEYEFSDGYKEILAYLISHGANIDDAPVSGESQGFTPLIFAARDNKMEIAKLLINNNANVNAKNLHDQTPLSLAEKGSHADMVKLLKTHGAK